MHTTENVLFLLGGGKANFCHSDDIYTLGMRGVHDGKMVEPRHWKNRRRRLRGDSGRPASYAGKI